MALEKDDILSVVCHIYLTLPHTYPFCEGPTEMNSMCLSLCCSVQASDCQIVDSLATYL